MISPVPMPPREASMANGVGRSTAAAKAGAVSAETLIRGANCSGYRWTTPIMRASTPVRATCVGLGCALRAAVHPSTPTVASVAPET
jgi:hypothetical protein